MLKRIWISFVFISSSVWACPEEIIDNKTDSFNIMMLVPSTQRDNFWRDFDEFSSSVAKSVGVNLCVHYFKDGERNRYFYAQALDKLFIKNNAQPDFIIGMFWLAGESHLLDLIEERKIPFISINSSLLAKDFEKLGNPGEKYKYWLMHISPNDVLAGRKLADSLVFGLPREKPPVMFGFSGDRISAAGYNRVSGLFRAPTESNRLELRQTVYTNWYNEDAKAKALALFERHEPNDINLVWTASDLIAKGVISAIEEQGLVAGKDILVGGMDWSIESRQLIADEKMLLSLGGHFVEGGVATILAFDYLSGKDFRQELGNRLKTEMRPMDKDNIDALIPYLNSSEWKNIDFRLLSKHYNSDLTNYNFSLEKMLQIKADNIFGQSY